MERDAIDTEVLVVDDSSPDGTADLVREMVARHPTLRLIVRMGERGAASAALSGFEAPSNEIVLAIDADFRHPPELIPLPARPQMDGKADITVTGRYVKGGGLGDWPLHLDSKGATMLGRLITSLKDPMSGFFALKKSVIKGVEVNIRSCKILLEILAKGNYRNIAGVPCTFKDRDAGESKIENQRMGDRLAHVLTLLLAPRSRLLMFAKFCTMGAMGAIINLVILCLFTEKLSVWYIFSAAVAAGVAVTSTYILNKLWTFHFETSGKAKVAASYVKFISVSAAGMGLNLALLWLFVDRHHIWHISSNIIAISVVAVWNYFGSTTCAFSEGKMEKARNRTGRKDPEQPTNRS